MAASKTEGDSPRQPWCWEKDLCDTVRRDIVDRPSFERLCQEAVGVPIER